MKVVSPVIIIPEKGETVFELATKIFEKVKSGEFGNNAIFLQLPNEEQIKVCGNSVMEFVSAIATQTEISRF